MKIGELSKRTKISVRTLHHYDEIGLLTPSNRTDGGYREYNQNDVLRLQRILALKAVGLQLVEINKVLGETISDVKKYFDQNIEKIEVEIQDSEKKLKLLKSVNRYFELKQDISLDEVLNYISDVELQGNYFSEDDIKFLENREKTIGDDRLKEVINMWPRLIEEVRNKFNNKVPVTDTSVQELAKTWVEIKEQFTGGNKEIDTKVRKMYEENPQYAERFNLTPQIFEYVKEAYTESLKSKESNEIEMAGKG